jgi:ADP-heptose:LPS heptosyltransferase
MGKVNKLRASPNAEFPELDLVDPMAAVTDFADTAALIQALDLVIAVDTSVPHLAGALGTPVWLLSRFDACWRWLCDRNDSPWYPTLRLFRQPHAGAWAPVLVEVAAALTEWVVRESPRADGT